MNLFSDRINKTGVRFALSAAVSIAVNILLSYLTSRIGLPFYLDTAGTIFISVLGGVFPGIMVAVATNLLCSIFNPYSLYYMIISVLIAICTAWFARYHKFRKLRNIPLYILILAVISGVPGTVFQWLLLNGPQFEDVAEISSYITGSRDGAGFFFSSMLINTGLNLVDKGIATGLAFAVFRFMPKAFVKKIREYSWKQKPLSDEEIRAINRAPVIKNGYPLKTRMAMMLTIAAVSLTVIMGFISINLHFEYEKREYTNNAENAARLAASIVDPAFIDIYIEDGEEVPGYDDTKTLLYNIRDAAEGVKYLYVIKIKDDGCYVAFDLETEDTPAYEPGDKIEFEEAFEPYLSALKAGEMIEPVESDDVSGWVLTAYYPIRYDNRVTAGYACADVSMDHMSAYVKDYLLRVLLIFSGFFVLVLGCGLWISGFFLVYPIGSMVGVLDGFMKDNDSQDRLDENVKKLRSLDIHTGDEVEKLYEAICRMASDTTEQMRSVRHYAQATASMQNGIIVTMADMVESRDSDTGAHVKKTAAYVRIILKGLKRKGYYVGKLTPKYMEDVEMSAPLHDVGKINVPDAVLNKPGKLTEAEFEIMKIHTTAGKEIMEKAIDTVKGGSYLKEARNMAAYHHERWDGKGYPEGLHGQVIPLSARVMAVADVFDALTSPRVYKPAFPLDKALKILEEGAGTQFDPKCVEVFMESLDEVKQVLRKYNEQ